MMGQNYFHWWKWEQYLNKTHKVSGSNARECGCVWSSVMFLPYLLPSSSKTTHSLPTWPRGMVLQALLPAVTATPGTSPLCTAGEHSTTQPPSVPASEVQIMASKHTSQGHHHTELASESGKTYMTHLQLDSMVPENKHSCHQFPCLSIVFISYLIVIMVSYF